MNDLPLVLAAFLLANLLVALVRVVRDPTAADRLLAVLLFGTTGVAVLLLLAHAGASPALVDVALVFALLAVITGVAFAQRAWRATELRESAHDADRMGE
jgi:multicomponent Na+:H+ antiporter subunit F